MYGRTLTAFALIYVILMPLIRTPISGESHQQQNAYSVIFTGTHIFGCVYARAVGVVQIKIRIGSWLRVRK